MKKTNISIFMLFLALALLSCGGKEKPPPGGPEGVLFQIRDAESFDSLMKCYSRETRKAVVRLIKKKIVPKERARDLLAIFDEDSSWEVMSDTRLAKGRVLTIEITRHRIENRAGEEMKLFFMNENGSWVIDMAQGFRTMEEMHRKSDAEGYLRKQFRMYQ